MKLPFLIALCVAGGTALAGTPEAFHPGCSPPNVVGSARDVCWSEPADLNGLIASSEQIPAYGFETEIANDFILPQDCITHVTWWGGYYNEDTPCSSGITTPGFNLKFYQDAGCMPDVSPYTWIAVTAGYFTEQSAGCQSGVFPLFKWDANIAARVRPGEIFWFSAQMLAHPFPPQSGRLGAGTVTGCDSAFRSVYFGYPDWTPAIDVFGEWFDASQEFTCSESASCIGAPPPPPPADVQDPRSRSEKASWGSIKSLYR